MSEQRFDSDFITQAAQRLLSRYDAIELAGPDSESAAYADELYRDKIKDLSPEEVQMVAARAEEIRAESEVAEARRQAELAASRKDTPPTVPVSDEVFEQTLEELKDPSERAVLDEMLGRFRYNPTPGISPVVREMLDKSVSTEPTDEQPYYPTYKKADNAFGGSTMKISGSNNPFGSHRSASKPPNKPKPEDRQ